jgi:hypothetical protein
MEPKPSRSNAIGRRAYGTSTRSTAGDQKNKNNPKTNQPIPRYKTKDNIIQLSTTNSFSTAPAMAKLHTNTKRIIPLSGGSTSKENGSVANFLTG